jgi:predicted HicB family RNase H-like nuclease
MQKVTPFQLRLVEELNREIKATAAMKGITKHEWIERAIREQLQREKAV